MTAPPRGGEVTVRPEVCPTSPLGLLSRARRGGGGGGGGARGQLFFSFFAGGGGSGGQEGDSVLAVVWVSCPLVLHARRVFRIHYKGITSLCGSCNKRRVASRARQALGHVACCVACIFCAPSAAHSEPLVIAVTIIGREGATKRRDGETTRRKCENPTEDVADFCA